MIGSPGVERYLRVVAEGRGYYGATSLIGIPGVYPYAMATQALGADTIYYFPFLATTPITINQVIIEITTGAAAGKKCRIAIYDADINWQPVVRKIVSAEIAIDGVAVVTTNVTATILPAGRYLIALILQEAATFRVVIPAFNFLQIVPTFGAGGMVTLVSVAQAYGALPDPGTAWTGVSVGGAPIRAPVLLQWTPGGGL